MGKIIKDEKVKGKHEKEESKDKIKKHKKENKQDKIKRLEKEKVYNQIKKYVMKINIMTDVSEKTLNKIFWNVIKAVAIVVYFMILNIAYSKMQEARILEDTKIFAGIFLIAGLIELERAYKKDSGKIAVTALELIVLSLFTLSIIHISTLLKYDFRLYVVTFSYLFAIYYIIKAVLIYTKEKKEYLQSLSDISDIVKKDKPAKKEAKKREKKNKKEQVSKEIKKIENEKDKAKTGEDKEKQEHNQNEIEKEDEIVDDKTENKEVEEKQIGNEIDKKQDEKQIEDSENKEEVKVND